MYDDDYRSIDSSGANRHNYRHAHSEDEIFKEEKEVAKKRVKQRRRSSFVAGSKISRYDVGPPEDQNRKSKKGTKNRPPNGGRKPRRKSNDDAYIL